MNQNTFVFENHVKHEMNKDMIGLFFEDINFAADGGLYAEMIENRSFEAVKSRGGSHDYILQEEPLYAWSASDESGELLYSINDPISEKNPHYLRFIGSKPGCGFQNKAYDGLCLKKGMEYRISFYAREVDYLKGDLKVTLIKDGKCYGDAVIPFIIAQTEAPDGYKAMVGDCASKDWHFYETTIVATEDVKGAVFELLLTEAGSVEFDLISMIPKDAVEGVFRKDLFEALKDLKPAFLRFPGGCIVEGTSLMRRYRWKDTVGSLKERKINTNLWGTQGGNTNCGFEIKDCHYMQSYGIGFYEYFLLCEKLSTEDRVCKPLPVLNIGVACQFRTYQVQPVDSEQFKEYIQDALDLIEFANGPVDSKWGSLRARMGHPESFHMDMLAIGNEQWESRHVDLYTRYRLFEKAIHEVYPEIKCLGTAGPFVNHELHTDAWNFYREEMKNNKDFTYAVDEHYYVAPQWLYDNVDFYDEYPRDISVFAGEYAAHDCNLTNSVESALAEAAMMTGMERNGDVVKLASYAPLFNRIGHSHWTPDMIWFDEEKVVLTPNYYVQKLFSTNAGSEVLNTNGQEKTLREKELYVSALKDGDSVIIKVVNASLEAQKFVIEEKEGSKLPANVTITTLTAKNGYKAPEKSAAIGPDSQNRAVQASEMSNLELCKLRFPEEVSVVEEKTIEKNCFELPAKSLTVIRFEA